VSNAADSLPQVCVRCRQMKAANTGKFQWSRHVYHRKIWVCDECGEKRRVPRLTRKSDETPPEREVREALERIEVKALAECPMAGFIFDFAVPKLRLILEVDSRSYHSSWKARRRDSHKDAWAEKNGWKLVRLRHPDLAQQVIHAIAGRRQELK